MVAGRPLREMVPLTPEGGFPWQPVHWPSPGAPVFPLLGLLEFDRIRTLISSNPKRDLTKGIFFFIVANFGGKVSYPFKTEIANWLSFAQTYFPIFFWNVAYLTESKLICACCL